VVTSPEVGDGKTTVTSNLAIALARIKKRVLVIDGDMRRPSLHRVFSSSGNGPGLVEFLRREGVMSDGEIQELVRPAGVDHLSFLPSGSPDQFDSALLHSARMRALIQNCKKLYQFVLIDTPPLMPISDARVWAQLADSAILVLRSGKTTREVAGAAYQALVEDRTAVDGVILNHWNPNKSVRYNRAYGRYGYYAARA
jgi:capsular exopolysaccharide synthesis family protein